jgi:hypothetical protein
MSEALKRRGGFLNDPRKLFNPFRISEYFRRIPRLGLDESKEIQWYVVRNRGFILCRWSIDAGAFSANSIAFDGVTGPSLAAFRRT